MKKTFCFDGESISFQASREELNLKLADVEQLIANYQEVASDLYSDAYMARGNGFCDTKYSEDFLDARLADLQSKADQLERWIVEF